MMFGLKTAAKSNNLEKVSMYLLPGEQVNVMEQLGRDFIAITDKNRLIMNKTEDKGRESTIYAVKISDLKGVGLYKKAAAVTGGHGVTVFIGSKEILLEGNDSNQAQEVFIRLNSLLFS